MGPGRCIVVPFSATPPSELTPAHVPFRDDVYPSLTEMTWAVCDSIRSVSHDRLDRVNVGGNYLSEMISEEDMARVEVGMRHALGIA
jgi:uncharacterized protein YifN (PemK superfamily)